MRALQLGPCKPVPVLMVERTPCSRASRTPPFPPPPLSTVAQELGVEAWRGSQIWIQAALHTASSPSSPSRVFWPLELRLWGVGWALAS